MALIICSHAELVLRSIVESPHAARSAALDGSSASHIAASSRRRPYWSSEQVPSPLSTHEPSGLQEAVCDAMIAMQLFMTNVVS